MSLSIQKRISDIYRIVAECYKIRADVIRKDVQERAEVERMDKERERIMRKADEFQTGMTLPPSGSSS